MAWWRRLATRCPPRRCPSAVAVTGPPSETRARQFSRPAEDKDAAWKWISFLSTAGYNTTFNEATGQLPVTKTDSESWSLHPKRFVTATVDSLPFAHMLPNVSQTSDFVNTVWPVNMQRALTGEISAKEMNEKIAELYAE